MASLEHYSSPGSDPLYFFNHSETGIVARSKDWSGSPIGCPEHWPPELKIMLGMMYNNRQPVSLFWGPEALYFYNDSYLPIVGQSKHPWAMGTAGNIVWGEIWELLEPQIRQVMSGGPATWHEDQYLPVLGDDGKPRDAYFTYSYSPVFLASGAIGGVLVTCTETTERRVFEFALQRSESKYRGLFYNMTEEVHCWQLVRAPGGRVQTWRLVDANPAALRTWNRDLRDIAGKTADEIFGPGAMEHFRPIVERITKDGKPYTHEDYFENLGRHFRFTSFAIGDLFYTTGADVTEVRQAEILLRSNEARFRELVDSIPHLAWTTDTAGKLVYVNARWIDYTGLSAEELGGDPGPELVHPDDRERVARHWGECIENGCEIELEFRLRGKNGEYHWFLTRAIPLRDEAGRVVRWFGTNTDVTELRRIKDELESAVESRDDFLSIASHELKTPLTSLMLNTQVMKRLLERDRAAACGEDRLSHFVKQTERQSLRLTRLIDDMLDISRIRTGRFNIRKERFDLNALIADVKTRFESEFIAKTGAPLQVESPGPVEGTWDRMRIEQVLDNLLTNALRYGERKPVRLTVEADADSVTVSVIDQGAGVAIENREKIFNRFERAGVSSNEISGLGLGLFITKQIVHAHGGTIWVEGEPGEGARFRFRLPRA